MAAVVETLGSAGRAFRSALAVPSRLLEVEAESDWGKGYPAKQEALRAASVVLTVAAWQGFVEDTAQAVLHVTRRKAGGKAERLADLATVALQVELERFNTPNMTNTSKLFQTVGFNLGDGWSLPLGDNAYTRQQASDLVNAWLHVRHSVAHGIRFRDNTKVLKLREQAHVRALVVTGKKPRGTDLALGAGDAPLCRNLFLAMQQLVEVRAKSYIKIL